MEFTLDLERIRRLLATERRQFSQDLAANGPAVALASSQQRHDGLLADAADAASLACAPGCDWCCHFSVDVRAIELFAIADHVSAHFSVAQQAELQVTTQANAAVIAAAEDRALVTLPCPFLQGGHCRIYPVRPQSCRNYHATDVAGCRLSFEQPDNEDIDPEFAPEVYQAGAAHVEAVGHALQAAGLESDVYELNAAWQALAAEPAARTRWLAGEAPFATLAGEPVPEEFDDLREAP